MLSKHSTEGRHQVTLAALAALEELVPQDHLVRKIDQVIDFNFIYDAVKHTYSLDNCVSLRLVNYARGFHDSDLFEQIFYRILREATNYGLVDPSVTFIDSTHVKAIANKKNIDKKVVRVETRSYQNQLEEEINIGREENGNKPLSLRRKMKQKK